MDSHNNYYMYMYMYIHVGAIDDLTRIARFLKLKYILLD